MQVTSNYSKIKKLTTSRDLPVNWNRFKAGYYVVLLTHACYYTAIFLIDCVSDLARILTPAQSKLTTASKLSQGAQPYILAVRVIIPGACLETVMTLVTC